MGGVTSRFCGTNKDATNLMRWSTMHQGNRLLQMHGHQKRIYRPALYRYSAHPE